MIELIQISYSPYCLVQRRLLEYARAAFRVVNIPNGDRSLVWRLTKRRYYQVPIVRDGRTVVFETDDDSQVIAKYLDAKLGLGLFPPEWDGVQSVLWRYFEREIEGIGFKLNDVYFRENLPQAEWLNFIRHKERKFGRGCLAQWRAEQSQLLAEFEARLCPCERMLSHRPYLLGDSPLFVDFDLYGMLANFLYSGHYRLPAKHDRLAAWHARIRKLRVVPAA